MNKILVLYQSKYGSAKQYAQWIQEAMLCDIIDLKHSTNKINFASYTRIVLVGGIYIWKISGAKYLKQQLLSFNHADIVVLAVGARASDDDYLKKLKSNNFSEASKSVTLFYARGKLDEHIMSFKDRTICKMIKKMASKENAKDTFSNNNLDNNWMDKENLKPLLSYLTKD